MSPNSKRVEIISIGTSKINIAFGTPLGAKNPRNFNNPCLEIAIKVTRINMERMIRKLEEFTGETFIENE